MVHVDDIYLQCVYRCVHCMLYIYNSIRIYLVIQFDNIMIIIVTYIVDIPTTINTVYTIYYIVSTS